MVYGTAPAPSRGTTVRGPTGCRTATGSKYMPMEVRRHIGSYASMEFRSYKYHRLTEENFKGGDEFQKFSGAVENF